MKLHRKQSIYSLHHSTKSIKYIVKNRNINNLLNILNIIFMLHNNRHLNVFNKITLINWSLDGSK
jgi:hypothetical protein